MMSIQFARVARDQFESICTLYQTVIADMHKKGLRQWEWEVYPTRAQLEEDLSSGQL